MNALAVGMIDTPRQQQRQADENADTSYLGWLASEARQRRTTLWRSGTDDEAASAIAYLLSLEPSFVEFDLGAGEHDEGLRPVGKAL